MPPPDPVADFSFLRAPSESTGIIGRHRKRSLVPFGSDTRDGLPVLYDRYSAVGPSRVFAVESGTVFSRLYEIRVSVFQDGDPKTGFSLTSAVFVSVVRTGRHEYRRVTVPCSRISCDGRRCKQSRGGRFVYPNSVADGDSNYPVENLSIYQPSFRS